MKTRLQTQIQGGRGEVAFTMIEIALSIAIVAFALVAIMGVLPTGLSVQRDNREDTMVSQDGQFFVDAIRNGVTNLSAISNNLVWMDLYRNEMLIGRYSNLSSREIIGVMSTPKYEPGTTNLLRLQARFMANSGALATRGTNTRDLAFNYLLSSEILPFTNFYTTTSNLYAVSLSTNLHEVRVTLRWPVLGVPPNDTNYGFGKQVFRTLVSGRLRQEVTTNVNQPNSGFYYFDSSTFTPAY